MIKSQLYIKTSTGDRLIDYDGIITVTKQSFDINNPGATRISYTNQLTLPPTQNNLDIFGIVHLVNSLTTVPYTQLPAKVVTNGLEILAKALCIVKGVDSNGITVNVFQDVITFWDAIDKKLLTDVTGTGINNSWYQGDITNYRNNATGLVAPILNYGAFQTGAPYNLNVVSYLPSVYYHSVINKIFSDAGYQKSGNIFIDAKYLAHAIPFSRDKWEYDSSFATERNASAQAAGGQVLNPALLLSFLAIQFTSLVNQDAKGYWDTVSKYIVTETDPTAAGKYLFSLDVFATLDITVIGGTVDLGFYNSTSGNYTRVVNVGTGVYNFTSNVGGGVDDIVIKNGDQVWVYVTKNTGAGAPAVTINSGKVSFIPRVTPAIGFGSYCYINKLLPNMTQKELLKDFAIRFGQVFDESRGVISCKGVDEIIADRAGSKDVTAKRDTTSKKNDMQFTPLTYAQINRFSYSNNDDLVPEKFGEGQLLVSNLNIEPDNTTYTSPFNNTYTNQLGSMLMAHIPIYAGAPGALGAFDATPGLRLVLIRNKYAYEPAVKFYLFVPETTYLVAYFDDPAQAFTMRFQQTIEQRYTLLRGILQKAKLVNNNYTLDDTDIQFFNAFQLWFDKDAYYIVNQIRDYIPNQVTKVQLLKA